MKLREWTNPKTSRQNAKLWQSQGYMTGEALARHVSTHGGVVDPNCPACNEIVRKMDRLKGV